MAAVNWLLSFVETLLLAAGGLCGLIVAICVGISKVSISNFKVRSRRLDKHGPGTSF